jgi:hypothetical protein
MNWSVWGSAGLGAVLRGGMKPTSTDRRHTLSSSFSHYLNIFINGGRVGICICVWCEAESSRTTCTDYKPSQPPLFMNICPHISHSAHRSFLWRGLKLTPVKGELGVFGFDRGVEVRLAFPPLIYARETRAWNQKKKKRTSPIPRLPAQIPSLSLPLQHTK